MNGGDGGWLLQRVAADGDSVVKRLNKEGADRVLLLGSNWALDNRGIGWGIEKQRYECWTLYIYCRSGA